MDMDVRSRKKTLDGERFFSPLFPSLETKQSLTLVTPPQQPSLFTAGFGGLKLCGLVPVPGNAWTGLAGGKPSRLCSFGGGTEPPRPHCQRCLSALCHTPRWH